jgi:translocation and assembly module TamB
MLIDMGARTTEGDRLLVLLDAEPDRDRFDIDLDLRAPAGGAVDAVLKLKAPLALRVEGAGSWARWRGTLMADLGTAQGKSLRIAALDVSADDGRFRVKGALDPSPFVAGAVASLLQPAIALDATIKQQGDQFQLTFLAGTPALTATGGGSIDPTANLVQGLRADVPLKKPEALSPQLSGTGFKGSLAIDGPFADPTIRWTVGAGEIRFASDSGPLGARGLEARPRLLNLQRQTAEIDGAYRNTAVTATLRGQPFDLKPHTQVTVARFEVKE